MLLITGGAGFIGSHLADALVARGEGVRILDDLSEQVHGPRREWPAELPPEAERVRADVRDPVALRAALDGVDRVVHLAARVGVGQSMYRVHDYVSTNAAGTAVLLEALIERPVAKLVVASSMSLYGEGLYETRAGEPRGDVRREREALERGLWEPRDRDGRPLRPLPTPEDKRPELASVYALGKYDQERLCLTVGAAYGIPTVALRLFNVYGPRQALSNPYTGVLAIFAARLLNGRPPILFEDGAQMRDFVSVHDVVRAFLLALDEPVSDVALNIGSGRPRSVREVARGLAEVMGRGHVEPVLAGKHRAGDVRHCFADITRAREVLGYEPRVELASGMAELAAWLEGRTPADRVEEAHAELAARGLAR